jgi:hypothetical protein
MIEYYSMVVSILVVGGGDAINLSPSMKASLRRYSIFSGSYSSNASDKWYNVDLRFAVFLL